MIDHMLAEMILFVVVLCAFVSLCVLMYLQQKNYSKQISELTQALIARSSKEFIDMKYADSTAKNADKEIIPEEIAFANLTDEQFMSVIEKSQGIDE